MGCCEPKDMKQVVRDRYSKMAEGSVCGCGCSGGSDELYTVFSDDYRGLEGYYPEADLNLGCGIPTEFAGIREGDTVIDLGSGAGNDCFVARRTVGDKGEVIGVDMTPLMIEKARANAQKLGYANVKFRLGDIENLPVTANKADVIISNCVINLVPDKTAAFREILRVLKPGGRFCISDVVTEGRIPESLLEQAELYAGCVSGAIQLEHYLDIISRAGFRNVRIHKKKRVELPDALLDEFLTAGEAAGFRTSGVGLFSITVTAEKPVCLCGCNSES